MSGTSFASVVVGLVPLGFLIWGLVTKRIVGPGAWMFKQHEEPLFFWSSVVFNAALAAFCFYFAVRAY